MFSSEFNFNCPIVGVEKDSNGDIFVTAFASDTLEDNDEERMSLQALTDMKDGIISGAEKGEEIDFLPSHRETFGLGSFVDADVFEGKRTIKDAFGKESEVDTHELFVKARLDKNDSRAIKLYNSVEAGENRYQLSIGGLIDKRKNNSTYWEQKEGGGKRKVINRISIDHIAVTRKNWASVGRTRFESAIGKNLEVPMGDMTEQIFKSLGEKSFDKSTPSLVNFEIEKRGGDFMSPNLPSSKNSVEEDMDKNTSDNTRKLSYNEACAGAFHKRLTEFVTDDEDNAEEILDSDIAAIELVIADVKTLAEEATAKGRKLSQDRTERLRTATETLVSVLNEVDPVKEEEPEKGADDSSEENDEDDSDKSSHSKKKKKKATKDKDQLKDEVEKETDDPDESEEDEEVDSSKTEKAETNIDAFMERLGNVIDDKLSAFKSDIDSKLADISAKSKKPSGGSSKQQGIESSSDNSADKAVIKRSDDNFLGPFLAKAIRASEVLQREH